MKRFLAALACLLLLPLCTAAESSPQGAAQEFIALLEAARFPYAPASPEDDGSTVLLLEGTALPAIRIRFDASGESATLSVPAFVTFPQAETIRMLRLCNTLNCDYMYTRFLADPQECTLSVSIDLLLGTERPGEVVWEALERLQSILAETLPLFLE